VAKKNSKNRLEEAPELLRRCVADVAKGKGGNSDVRRAFAICTAGLQKSGRLKKDSNKPTNVGRTVSAKKYKASDAKSKHADYEKLLKANRKGQNEDFASSLISTPGLAQTAVSEPTIGGVKKITQQFLTVASEFEQFLKRATHVSWELDRDFIGDSADEATFSFFREGRGGEGPCFAVTVDYQPTTAKYNLLVKYHDKAGRVVAQKRLRGVDTSVVWDPEKVFGSLMPRLFSEEDESSWTENDILYMRVLAGIEGDISPKELKIESFYRNR